MAYRSDCASLSEPESYYSVILINKARRIVAALIRYAGLGWIAIQVIVQIIHHHHPPVGNSSEGPHDSKQPHTPRFRRWRHYALMAAVAALQFFRYADYAPAEYFTSDVDHPLHVTLDDGSKLDLRGDSVVALQRTEAGARFRVPRGEVVFTIVHDAQRHVDVLAGSALIQVLGTQFDVAVHHENTTVAVIDGSVVATRLFQREISAASDRYDGQGTSVRLRAGEITEMTRNSSQPAIAQPVSAETIRAMLSWNIRSFADGTLDEVVEELNQHNAQPKIVIEDPSILTMRIGGFGIHMNDPQEFIDRLERAEPSLRATKARDGRIFLRRRSGYTSR